MKVISAHITGFYHSSFHAYTTEVNVDGHRWRLGLRYSKFYEFYEQLVEKKKDFHAEFPPKGTLFFTPKPKKRQEQLEIFMQHVLEYYAAKGHPTDVEELLCDLLKVPRHLRSPEREDDDVSTSTESVLDEPIHEPPTSSDSVVAEKPQAAETKETEKVPVQEAEPEFPIAMEEKGFTTAPESEQPASPVAEETLLAHEDEEEVEKPEPAKEPKTVKKTVGEDVATVADKEAVRDDEVKPILTKMSAKQPAETTIEKAPMKKAVAEVAEVEADTESSPEEPDVNPTKNQPLVEPTSPQPQVGDTLAASKNASPTQHVEQKELTASGGVSSWIAAIFPKSLLGFIRRRCMKKTNLVVLCVALLLPMVLARR